MKRTVLWGFALICVLGFSGVIPLANAQPKLVAQKVSLTDTTITPPDPTVPARNDSLEIMALDVPPISSCGYLQFTSTVLWEVDITADTPVRAFFRLGFIVTSLAMPPGITLSFSIPMASFRRASNGSGMSLEGGTATDSEVLTRKILANLLLLENTNALTPDTAMQIADGLFEQGFHVSVRARLTSRNISSATVSNPNVAFFAQPGSQE